MKGGENTIGDIFRRLSDAQVRKKKQKRKRREETTGKRGEQGGNSRKTIKKREEWLRAEQGMVSGVSERLVVRNLWWGKRRKVEYSEKWSNQETTEKEEIPERTPERMAINNRKSSKNSREWILVFEEKWTQY